MSFFILLGACFMAPFIFIMGALFTGLLLMALEEMLDYFNRDKNE